jgi:DNA polymerase IV (DinB-like DNA polymerase)
MTDNTSDRVIMCADLDYFYAQVEEVRNPSLRDKPLVVCVFSGRSQDSGAVATSNYVARRLGVKSGIPISFAKKTLATHPDAVFLPMDHDFYESMSDRVMYILRRNSSGFEQASIDEAYLDVSKESDNNFGLAEKLGQKIKKEILREEKLTCSIGIGPNKLLAKMAADAKKPDGLTIIRPDEARQFLDVLPIGKLFGIGPKIEEKLSSLGIASVRQLANSDPQVLSRAFGDKLGPQLRDTAMGVDDDPVKEREVEQFSRIVTLKHDAMSYDFADVLAPLAQDLSSKLKSAQLRAESIGIIAITTHLRTRTRAKKVQPPTDSGSEILNAASELFRSFFEEEKSGSNALSLRRVGLRASDFGKKEAEILEKSLSDFF